MKGTLQERFEDSYMPEPNSGCWLWIKAAGQKGYGVIGLGGRKDGVRLAHRVAWELYRGPLAGDICVLHRCDNPWCVNPDHLFLGTRSDNNKDMTAKGRHWRAKQTNCLRGHPYTRRNAKQRQCVICRNAAERARHARIRKETMSNV